MKPSSRANPPSPVVVSVNQGSAWMPGANASSFCVAEAGIMIHEDLTRSSKGKMDLAYRYFENSSLIPRRNRLSAVEFASVTGQLSGLSTAGKVRRNRHVQRPIPRRDRHALIVRMRRHRHVFRAVAISDRYGMYVRPVRFRIPDLQPLKRQPRHSANLVSHHRAKNDE